MRLVFAGIIHITTHAGQYLTEVSDKPCICPLARFQATRGRFVTNRRHQPVMLDPLAAVLIPLLDGTRDIDALIASVAALVEEGKLSVLDKDKQVIQDPTQRADTIKGNCQLYVQNFARQALLISPTTHRSKVARAKEALALQ
jgi:methyltransferase-like protein